jgi:hypothetical protein
MTAGNGGGSGVRRDDLFCQFCLREEFNVVSRIFSMASDILMLVLKCFPHKPPRLIRSHTEDSREVPETKNRIAPDIEVSVISKLNTNGFGPLVIRRIHGHDYRHIEDFIRIITPNDLLYLLLSPTVFEWAHFVTEQSCSMTCRMNNC